MTVFVAPVAKASINPPFNNDVISRIPWRLRNKSRPLFEYLSIEMYVHSYIRYYIGDVVLPRSDFILFANC